ncbi:hypothetical protein [Galbibacter mesophilus]|uniref:hypothetical protein n=1 Tax=Galbibacter mesophilus TaxID=379069 RepID=UPI00191CC93D|nr:hypothetical protein [Galbibacter mesophilus]MCM5663384.1 hypothetical protein [Galbibacter mesophilus]
MNPSLKRLHFISGIAVTVFIVLHFFNHLTSVFSIETHIAVMDSLRKFYRNVFIEPIIIAAFLFQIASGLWLVFKKRKGKTDSFEKIQMISGVYLALFLLVHLAAVYKGRYELNLDTNFYYGATGINKYPSNVFFIPYYGLAMLSFFGHISGAHARKMKRNVLSITPKKQAYLLFLFGVIITLLIFFGLTNKLTGLK